MARVEFAFDSKEIAQAFIDGVQYVNESTIEVEELVPDGEFWRVVLEDEDAREDSASPESGIA